MPNFRLINNASEINLSDRWADAAKFNSESRIVDRSGKKVSATYAGRKYRLIAKKERVFSRCERIKRGFLGTVAIVCTLGIALLCKRVRKLFTQEKAKVRFGVLLPKTATPKVSLPDTKEQKITPKVISKKELEASKCALEKEIALSDETISKIQSCMQGILKRKEEGIKFYEGQGNHRIFSLDSAPGYIFKMKASKNVHVAGRDDSMRARYQKKVLAHAVCCAHKLGLLVIPQAKLFTVTAGGEEYEIIAEKKADIESDGSMQEEYFEKYASSLDETIRQLAILICETGYSDIEWRNIPILNGSLDKLGHRKIVLIDLEEMEAAATGLFGTYSRRGLVGCVNQKQGKMVEQIAKKYSVATSSFKEIYDQRMQELEEGEKLREFYKKNNITTGREQVQVDLGSLGLNLDQTTKNKWTKSQVSFREVAENVVQEINRLISESSEKASVKGRRYLCFSTNREAFKHYHSYPSEDLTWEKGWLYLLTNALVEKGHIFKVVKQNGHGWFIQA